MREVIPGVFWIGNAHDARDVKRVLARGIAVVIDLAIEEPPIQFPRDIVYCRFPLTICPPLKVTVTGCRPTSKSSSGSVHCVPDIQTPPARVILRLTKNHGTHVPRSPQFRPREV